MCRRACHRRNSSWLSAELLIIVLSGEMPGVTGSQWMWPSTSAWLSAGRLPHSPGLTLNINRESDLIFSCRNKTLPVYNCTSGGVNPVTWGYFETTGMKITRKFPMENILWYPGGSYKENKTVNSVCEVSKDLTKRRGGERVCVFSLSNTPFLLTSVTPHSGS